MTEFKTNLVEYKLIKVKTDFPRAKIGSSKDANEYMRNFYLGDLGVYESFFGLFLNNANNTIGYVKISQGGITGTVVDVKIFVKYAIDLLATGVILGHNHPSGTLKPSQADKNITKKLQDALAMFDVKVLDHVIITEDTYFSFADENIL